MRFIIQFFVCIFFGFLLKQESAAPGATAEHMQQADTLSIQRQVDSTFQSGSDRQELVKR